MTHRILVSFWAVAALTARSVAAAAAESSGFRVHPGAGKILDQYCLSCHEDGTTKGDVRLDNLSALPLDTRLDLINRMLEQVYFQQVPPLNWNSAKPPPTKPW